MPETIRINQKYFINVSRSMLNDVNISWAAKGLYATLESFDKQFVGTDRLLKASASSTDETHQAVEELIAAGYLQAK